jgi:asparagine synthetase B (glutamine-hydrolysing)
MRLIHDYQYFDKKEDFKGEKEWVMKNVEEFQYKWSQTLKTDSGATALSKICRTAHDEGRKVYLSGQGGDEIISDYALRPNLSTFKGVFPNKLDVWENFYNGCQYSYLGKEEYVAGAHSVEARYPFLDYNVVQEFLWLKPELKNVHYKAPIREYLVRNNFPFSEGKKEGLTLK